jgi:hypothetical protein
MKRAWSFAGVMALALTALASPAAAKRTGMNLACHNCHEGTDKPKVSVALSAARIEPGQSVTVTVTAMHERAKVGGVLVDSKGLGTFEVIDALGTRLFDNTVTQATHAMPQPYANGQVQFAFRWVAPATAGAAMFDVWSNAANDNLKPDDDSAGETVTGVSVGCDGVWYYKDFDKDGAGAEKEKIFSCTPIPDRILTGGDCEDLNALVGPAMPELCNSIDDDCDGVADDGFTPVLLVADADGDGHGSTSGMSMIGCPPIAGFAPSFDDCNDLDPAVHPGVTETANGRDDNCNGKVDDVGVAMPGTAGSAGTTNTLAPATADAGCAFAPPARLRALPLFGTALLFGWAHARRAGRRARRNESGVSADLQA